MSDERLGLLRDIERAAVAGWPALETEFVDGWLWRHASGGSTRANSVAALAYSGADIEASVARIEALYRSRRAPVRFTISEVSEPAGLDGVLARRGYAHGDDHVTMAKPVAARRATATKLAIETSDRPSAGWLAAYLSGLSASRRDVAPRILAGLPRAAIYASAMRAGEVVASGLSIADGAVASVQCMATLPAAQRQGAATAILAAIERQAAAAGCRALYLQTGAGNDAAIALYRRFGFAVISRYHTRRQ